MMGAGLAYVAIFMLAAAAAWLAARLVGNALGDRGLARKRYEGPVSAPADLPPSLKRRRGTLVEAPPFRRLTLVYRQSGVRMSPAALVAATVLLAGLIALLLPAPAAFLPRLAVSVPAAGAAIYGLLSRSRARRLRAFGEQFPDILDIITRSLRAGHPLPVALELAARETPAPAGPEFALVVDEITYGRSIAEALENLHDRVGYPELRFFVAATSIAGQTGGNLGEILGRLSRMLRERFRFVRRVRAITAEGRFSGLVLSIMPVALFGLVNVVSPGYYGEFWSHPAATTVATASIALLLTGNLVILRLVNFKA